MKKLVKRTHFAKRTLREEYKLALTAISVTNLPCLWVKSYVFFLFITYFYMENTYPRGHLYINYAA